MASGRPGGATSRVPIACTGLRLGARLLSSQRLSLLKMVLSAASSSGSRCRPSCFLRAGSQAGAGPWRGALNTTDLDTGRSWVFRRGWAGEVGMEGQLLEGQPGGWPKPPSPPDWTSQGPAAGFRLFYARRGRSFVRRQGTPCSYFLGFAGKPHFKICFHCSIWK